MSLKFIHNSRVRRAWGQKFFRCGVLVNSAREKWLGCLFLFCLFGSSALAANHLIGYARLLDHQPVFRLEQPLWASDESRLAFLKIPKGSDTAQLWWAHRTSEERGSLTRLEMAQNPRLLGWLAGDRNLAVWTDEGLRLFSSQDGTATELPDFLDELNLIGVRESELYYWRELDDVPWEVPEVDRPEQETWPTPEVEASPTSTPTPRALTRRAIEVVAWNPGWDEVQTRATIPLAPTDKPEVDGVAPSPDGRFLALIMRFAADRPQGIWLLDSETDELLWTGIQTDERFLKVAWSDNSVGILTAASEELFLMPNVLDTKFSRLSTSPHRDLMPFWGANNVFILGGERSVLKLEREGDNLKATTVLAPQSLGEVPRELTISPAANWAAFLARDEEEDQLRIVSLKTEQVRQIDLGPSGEKGRQQLLYRIADGLRYARYYWLGGSL